MRDRRLDLRVYVIVGPGRPDGPEPRELAEAAIRGGATVLQVRAKDVTTRDLLELARTVVPIGRAAGVPVLINDRCDVALAASADGVHLGPDDLPLDAARRLMGPDAWIGWSAGTAQEAVDARRQGADYLGVGDVFGTASKADAGVPVGLDGLRDVVATGALPTVAIGGITVDNAGAAIATGADGVAVLSAIHDAPQPDGATSALRERVDAALADRPRGATPAAST